MINKYWILFIVAFKCLMLPADSKACGPSLPDVKNFELLDPLVFPDSTYRPFYYEPQNPYYY